MLKILSVGGVSRLLTCLSPPLKHACSWLLLISLQLLFIIIITNNTEHQQGTTLPRHVWQKSQSETCLVGLGASSWTGKWVRLCNLKTNKKWSKGFLQQKKRNDSDELCWLEMSFEHFNVHSSPLELCLSTLLIRYIVVCGDKNQKPLLLKLQYYLNLNTVSEWGLM